MTRAAEEVLEALAYQPNNPPEDVRMIGRSGAGAKG
jgi:hypothetical protein